MVSTWLQFLAVSYNIQLKAMAIQETYNLFIYGTLTTPAVFRAVLGRNLVSKSKHADGVDTFLARRAILNGYKKISPDNTYLYAIPDKGHRIIGYLVENLPRETLPALMEYEGRNYSRRTLKVQTGSDKVRAIVFVGRVEQLEHSFGHEFRDPLKQEILLERKIDEALREAEEEQFHTSEDLTHRAIIEMRGVAIRNIKRRHFEVGGISDFAIRHTLRNTLVRDYDRVRTNATARALAPHYLRMVIRQVVFNQFEERIRDEFRYELNHLHHSDVFYERIISSLVALRILNQSKAVLDSIINDCLEDLQFPTNHLIEFVRRAIAGADLLYDSKPARTHINFIRSHMGFGFVPLGAALEFSNIGHDVIRDSRGRISRDLFYDGFMYFEDFGLDVVTWKLGGHIDNHHEKAPGHPRRGFFEVAIGNLSIEANISKPITSDPWILNQLIHQTRQFYEIKPHSIHISMQPRSQHRPNRDRLLPLSIMKCLFAIAGDPVREDDGRLYIQRLRSEEIIRMKPKPNMLFSDISKRYSDEGSSMYLPGEKEGRYVQQFRFLRLFSHLNYEPIIMGLKGIQLSLRPGSFMTPRQWETSRRHRKRFEDLLAWGRNASPIDKTDIAEFLSRVEEGLMTERRGKPAHSQAYIQWAISQLSEMLLRFNKLFLQP